MTRCNFITFFLLESDIVFFFKKQKDGKKNAICGVAVAIQ